MNSIESYFAANIAADYVHYQRFCAANGLQVAAYTDFLSAIPQNFVKRTAAVATSKVNSSCGSCGGGKVR